MNTVNSCLIIGLALALPLASASADTTALIWDLDVLEHTLPLSVARGSGELGARWETLAGEDAAKAFTAIREPSGSLPPRFSAFLGGCGSDPEVPDRVRRVRFSSSNRWRPSSANRRIRVRSGSDSALGTTQCTRLRSFHLPVPERWSCYALTHLFFG